jgi:hypothetical protein
MTSLPLDWKSKVWMYQAPARSTWPDAQAASAPPPPFSSLESYMITQDFL